jgi:uncharacterized protein
MKKKGSRLEIYKDRKKEYRWRIVAANGKKLAMASEGYKNKKDMMKALTIVQEVIWTEKWDIKLG